MINRYDRQMRFEPIGENGQDLISSAHVLLVGCGALGTSTADTLVRAGIKKLTIIDRDYVEHHNLQRQQLFTEEDAANKTAKAKAAARYLRKINRNVEIEALVQDFQKEEADKLVPTVSLVMDSTDNFETRLLINDAAYRYKVPWIYGGLAGSHGLSITFMPKEERPCLRCLAPFMTLDETCDTAGVIAPAAQMVTTIQNAEALKILSGNTQAVSTRLYKFDLWENESAYVDIERLRNEDCMTCGEKATYPQLKERRKSRQVRVLCGGDSVHIRPQRRGMLSFENLHLIEGNKEWAVKRHEDVCMLQSRQKNIRVMLFEDGRALLHGTNETEEAEQIYEEIVDVITDNIRVHV